MATAVGLAGCSPSPESTVEKFYKALSKGELTEAVGYVSAQVVSMVGQQKLTMGLSKASEQMQACGGLKSVKTDLTGQGEIRTGMALIEFKGDCKPSSEKVKLLKEDGQWKLGADK